MTCRLAADAFRRARGGYSRPKLMLELLEDRRLLDATGPAGTGTLIKWTFGDTQNNLYVLNSFSPQDANVGPIGALDPSINLVIGDRYTAIITSFPHHPLELIAGGATPFDDVVLLAQTNKDEPLNLTAKWESDPSVDWVTDSEAKSVSFTLTAALAAAMFDPVLGLTAQYRCGNPFHRGFQRGALLLSSGTLPSKDAPHDGLGDAFATSSSLSPDASGAPSASGTLETSGSVDLFRYVAPFTGSITVTQSATPGSSLNSLLLIYNSSQQLIDVGGTGVSGAASVAQIPVVAGNTYYIQSSGYQGSTGSFHLSVANRPSTSSAFAVPSIGLDARGSASLIGNITTLGGQSIAAITATAAGQMTVTQTALPGSPIDPLLLVYNSSGILVAADNDGAGSQTSQVQFSVVPGQIVKVSSGALGLSMGSYRLSISTRDTDDTLAQAKTLTLSTDATASISGRVDEAGESDYYQFAAPFTGRITVEEDAAPGSTMRVAPAILDRSGNPIAAVVETSLAGGAIVRLEFSVTEGQLYVVRAGAQGTDTGADVIYIAPDRTIAQSASPLSIALSSSGSASVDGAIGLPGSSTIYSFTATVSGLMAISQQASGGTALDSLVSVYNASMSVLASDDESGGGRNSLIKTPVTSGQTYFVRAAGFGSTTGQYILTLATDSFGHDFADATPIHLDQTSSGRETGSIGWSGEADVFQFSLNAPRSLAIALESEGSTFDGVLQIYDSNHTLIAQNDDDGEDDYDSKVSVQFAAGQSFYVVVAGYGSSIGAYDLFVGNGLGSDRAHAFPISLDSNGFGSLSGSIDQPGEVTTLKVVAPASGSMSVAQLSAAEGDFTGYLVVQDAMGTTIASQLDQDIGIGPSTLGDTDELSSQMAKVTVPVTAGQTYYLQVGGQGSSIGEYVIDVAINDAAANPTNPVVTDLALDPSSRSAGLDGQIALAGDLEVFRITAPSTGKLVINQTAPPGSFIGSVTVRSPGTPVLASDNAAVGGEDPQDAGKGYSRLTLKVTAGQVYLIQVSGVASSIGSFHLDIKEFPDSQQNLATLDITQGVTPEQMVAGLLGPGNTSVQIVPGSVVYTGAPNASGLFSGGRGILDTREGGAINFDSGVVLTNGNAFNIIGPNDQMAATEINGEPGSPLLDKVVRGGSLDASTLTFQLIPTTNVIQLRYVFASEEYDTFVGTPFDDVFGFFVNGQDYSRVPGTGTPLAGTGQTVSVNTINNQVNSQYYIDNTFGPLGGFGNLNTQMNGLTRVLLMQAPVVAGQVNTIVLTVADTLDPQVDSAVMIQAGSLQAIRENVAPAAGELAFAKMLQTLSSLGPSKAAGLLTTAQLQLALQQAVVNGVIKSSGLTGNFIIIPIDPVDFTLTGPSGLSISSSAGTQVSASVPNAFFTQDGSNQLLIIPNANPGEYQVSLVGTGSGESLFGASYVSTSSGQVTSILLSGNLQAGATSAVLDFQNPDGQLVQETIASASPAGSPGGALILAANGLSSLSQSALGVLFTQLTFLELSTATVDESAGSAPGAATALAPIAQPRFNDSTRSANDPDNLSRGPKHLLERLWERVENSLADREIDLDAFSGTDGASVLVEVVTWLRPDLKASNGLLRYAASVLRPRVPRVARARPGRAAPPGRTSGASSPRAIQPLDAPQETTALPVLPEAGDREVEPRSSNQNAAPRIRFPSGAELCAKTAATLIVIANMGLSRMADRRALRLSIRTNSLRTPTTNRRF